MRKVFDFILAVMICGCSQNGINKQTVEVINVDFRSSEQYFDISPLLADSIEIIPLESIEGSLVGEISDVRVTGNRIFITDKMSNKIKVFDRKGKYIFQIGNLGRGPGEYLGLSSTEVIDDSTMAVFDHFSVKLLYYNTDNGRFIKNRDISKIWAMDIVYMDGNLYFVNDKSMADMGYYLLYSMEDGSDKAKAFLPFDKKMEEQTTWGLERYYSKNNDELMLYFPPYDTLYMVSGEHASAKYFVDFGDRKVPESVIDLPENRATAETVIKEKYIKGVDKVHLTDDYILIDFAEYDEYTAVYNRKTKRVDVCRFIVNSRLGGMQLFGAGAIVRDNCLITSLPADDFNAFFGETSNFPNPKFPAPDREFTDRIKTVGQSINLYDNPVLFIQKFK